MGGQPCGTGHTETTTYTRSHPQVEPAYFTYLSPTREAGISSAHLEQIKRGVRADYPGDDMLYELRLLRICRSIRDGYVTAAQVLEEFPHDRPASAA